MIPGTRTPTPQLSFTDHVQLALLASIRRDGRIDVAAVADDLPAGADGRDIETALGHLIDDGLIDLSLWEVGPRITPLGDHRLDADGE
jgi:hypothetical protein